MNDIIEKIDQWLSEHDAGIAAVPIVPLEDFQPFRDQLAEQYDPASLRAALALYHCRPNQDDVMHVYKAIPAGRRTAE